MSVRELEISGARARRQVEFTPARLGQCGGRFRDRHLAAPEIFAGQRHVLFRGIFKVSERVWQHVHKPSGERIDADAQVLPRARLWNALFHRFPVRPGGFQRRIIAQHVADNLVERQRVAWAGGVKRRVRFRGHHQRNGDDQRTNQIQFHDSVFFRQNSTNTSAH